MIKSIKNNFKIIFAFTIGAILSGFITAYAAGILASEIKFTPNSTNAGWNAKTVEEALNDLYTSSNLELLEKMNLNVSSNSSFDYRKPNRSTSLELGKGEYIVFTTGISGFIVSSRSADATNASAPLLTDTEHCEQLKGYNINPAGTTTYSSKYYGVHEYTGIWTCKLDSTTTITANSANPNDSSINYVPGSVIMHAVKIS